jgi:hypothetical protein
MKKLILICLVASLLPAAFGAQIIKDSEFDLPYAEGDATSGGTLLWWGNWNYTHTWGFYFTGILPVPPLLRAAGVIPQAIGDQELAGRVPANLSSRIPSIP